MEHGCNTDKEAIASPACQGALLREPRRKAAPLGIFAGVTSEPAITVIVREQDSSARRPARTA
jgi:hypothetical protein